MRVLLCFLLVLAAGEPLRAQSLVNPTAGPVAGFRQEGGYVTAPITLDGIPLFRIAALANPQSGLSAIAARQSDVENALAQLVLTTGSGSHQRTVYDPRTIEVEVVPVGQQAVVQATDATHKTPTSIVTATSTDAKYYGMTPTSVADRWQAVLLDQLRVALRKRQPAVERNNERQVAIVGAALVVVTALFWFFIIVPVGLRSKILEQRLNERESQMREPHAAPSANHSSAPVRRRRFLALALRAEDPARRLHALRTFAAMLVWVLVLFWFAAVVWALLLFPQTTPLGHQVLHTLVALAATWIVAGLMNRILDLVIARAATIWRHRRLDDPEQRARELLRIPTFTGALSGFKTFALIFIALLVSLGEIGIPVWSVVTFGGLTAIGITLAAQNFVRDFLNGFLVLFEDQYVVGDYITINAQSGIVETLTLRVVQLRDAGGNVITIPHSSVTWVMNHSRNWSRVDFRVSVEPSADMARAMELVRQAIESLAGDERWRGSIVEPLEWIGLDSLSRDSVVIRASVKTAPLRQFELRRALNERVRLLFSKAGIGFGAALPEAVS